MTAEEIRALRPKPTSSRNQNPAYQESDYRDFQIALIQELVAQLAELNALLRKELGGGLTVVLCASNDDIPVRVKE